jgi:dTDP-4-amino-4,6-dideoxygalactose transaminase
MKIPFVDLKSQYLSIQSEIDKAISSVISETTFIGGKYVQQFKKDFEASYGVKHCIPVANGTDAIYITMKMLGIGTGDEVITTASSWISTSETISQTGAKPVFVDIDPNYYTIDVSQIEKSITPATKAIIPVHLYGQMADMQSIKNLCQKYNLFLIEDCAQSHYSVLNGIRAGLAGVASTFSFYPGKNLGAYGDAGCIITNDDELAVKMTMYSNHGALKKHQHQIEGINSRLDGIQAAILSAKLPHIHQWTEARINHAASYTRLLKGVGDLKLPVVRPDSIHSFHLYVIRTKKRDQLKEFLESNGIETAVHYPFALPLMEAYKYLGSNASDFPEAFKHQNEILSIPMYPELSVEQIDFVVDSIKSFYETDLAR